MHTHGLCTYCVRCRGRLGRKTVRVARGVGVGGATWVARDGWRRQKRTPLYLCILNHYLVKKKFDDY